jgi:hypothetical protein
MLDAIFTVASTIGLFFILVMVAARLTADTTQRLIFAAIAGAWVGVASAVAGAGTLQDGPLALPALLVLFLTPLILTTIVVSVSARARATLLAFPMALLIVLNMFRVLGAFFLVLAGDGRLGGPFPYSAGWGDIITGALALPVAWAAMRNPNAQRLTLAWNTFGTLDLIVAVTLGVTSRNNSPIQLFHAGVGSQAITTLPWAIVPTVLVPFYLITHAVIFAQLRARAPVAQTIALSPG